MKAFEMGGYLPLELQTGKHYFADLPDCHVLAVNTGRTAIWWALNSLEAQKVAVPYYYCPDIIEMLKSNGFEIIYYYIGEDMLPLDIPAEEDCAVILVNYYGLVGNKLKESAGNSQKVVFDHAHGFYEPPVMAKGVMNVYSCRKFFGVSDGAYLIGLEIKDVQLERDLSYNRAEFLMKSIELGTNGAYSGSKHNEEVLGSAFLSMSELTERILDSIDYQKVAQVRNENLHVLHECLKDYQRLQLDVADQVPYAYPLLLDRDIHRQLVEKKIYVPVLWKQLLDEKMKGTVEQQYARCIVALPLDQRYGPENMKMLAKIVEQCVQETGVS